MGVKFSLQITHLILTSNNLEKSTFLKQFAFLCFSFCKSYSILNLQLAFVFCGTLKTVTGEIEPPVLVRHDSFSAVLSWYKGLIRWGLPTCVPPQFVKRLATELIHLAIFQGKGAKEIRCTGCTKEVTIFQSVNFDTELSFKPHSLEAAFFLTSQHLLSVTLQFSASISFLLYKLHQKDMLEQR